MNILRLRADGFGCMRGECRFPRDRVALVLDDNERGKSTMIAAIQAALYGLEDDRRRERVLTPRDRYRPWDGGSYRVELEIESAGETFTLKRDFAAGRVEVWNARGQDVTEKFREGKDDYPVGTKLIGLAEAEFEKCALLRHGDAAGVVPADEKARRHSTLHARLEAAVDTRVGDANAAEALEALELALRGYNAPELETTLQVENAVKRFQIKKDDAEIELGALEKDFRDIAAEAAELADLDEKERASRDAILTLEQRKRQAMAADWRREAAENEKRVAELEELRREAAALEAASSLPRNAEAELRETVARLDEAQRNLESMQSRRAEDKGRVRVTISAELADVARYQNLSAEDADQCVALAAEIRRLVEEDRRLREEAFRSRDRLAARGFDPERIQWLNRRFAEVPAPEQKLLREQAGLSLTFQTEVARLEQERSGASEALRAIDQLRGRSKVPGWILAALGFGAAIAGGVVLALAGRPALYGALVGGGLLVAGGGAVVLALAGKAKAAERAGALRKLSQAQHQLNLLKEQRARAEMELDDVARRLGCRDRVDLLREWTEYARLLEENEPAIKAQERLAELQEAKRGAEEKARALLARAGGGEPDPAALERAAAGARRALVAKEKLRELESGEGWAVEKSSMQAMAASIQERAVRILESVGLAYDPALDWPWYVEQVAQRVKGAERRHLLMTEIIPRQERQLLSEERLRELRSKIEEISHDLPLDEAESGTTLEHEAALERERKQLEETRARHKQLRERVGSRYDHYFARRPVLAEDVERFDCALGRAQRFKQAVELARDTLQSVAVETHRRWGDFLNQRVAELLANTGTNIEQVRFGEDLDFSVRLGGDQQLARPRADLQLSAGARDQLYLAMRIAVSEYLSRGQVRLPLLLDDPLVTSDDERAQKVFALLTEELSREHQIILFSCHRARFDAFAGRNPELFARRVQVLDVRGITSAGTRI